MAIGIGLTGGGALGSAPAIAVEDLLQGMGEWRNIQDVIRASFKAFHDIIKSQGDAIRDLEKRLENKANKTDVEKALSTKASVSDIGQRLEDLQYSIGRKAGADEVASVVQSELSAALGRHKEDVQELISRQLVQSRADSWREVMEVKVAELQRETRQRAGLADGLGRKVDQAALQASEKELRKEIYDVRNDLNKTFKELAMHKADTKDMEDMAAELGRLRSSNQGDSVSGNALRSLEAKLGGALADLKGRVDSSAGVRERLVNVEARVEVCEMFRTDLARKMDTEEARQLFMRKADISDMNEALASKANAALVEGLLDTVDRRDRAQYSSEELASMVKGLRDEVSDKIGRKEIGPMLQAKANVDDVNSALLQVSNELESKASSLDLEELRQAQAQARTLGSADNTVGRWIWKTGRTKSSGLVPWNIQSVNSDAQNFLWEKDKANILVDTPGLYEVTFGFFSRRKPTVQLLINGEPVLAAVNSASYVIHHSSGRLTSVGRHPAGNITGLTLIDFLALPPRAKVSISFSGEDPGEGFLSLKKL